MTTSLDRSRPQGRRFGRLARMCVVVVSLLVGLVITEVAIRIAGLAPGLRRISLNDPDSVYQKSDNPILGFELKPDYRAETPDSYLNYPRTNAHGQRDVERSIEKPIGIRRLILLGDSVVEGFGVREIDQLISRQMEQRLADQNWEVLNFGVSGYCTLAEVEMLKTKGLPFAPDAVILIFVQNDFENYNQDNAGVASGEPPSRIVRAMMECSHLFRYGYAKLGLGGGSEALSDNNVAEGLDEFARLAAERGFQPVVAVWPQFENARIVDPRPMLEGGGDLIVERLARMHGIPVYRLSEAFRRHRQADGTVANPRVRYSVEGDGMHATPEAAAIAATELVSVLGHVWEASSQGQEPFQPKSEVDTAAVIAAGKISQNDPENAQRYSNQANVYARKDQPAMAAAYYELALQIDDSSADVHTNYGKTLAQLDRNKEAGTHLRKAIELAPEHAFALTNLGVFLIGEGEFAEAATHLRKAVAVEPNRADSHFHLGRAIHGEAGGAREMLQEAARHYQQALGLRPDYVMARYQVALVMESLGDLAAAAEQYRLVIAAAPEDVRTLNNLAWILATANDGELRNGEEAIGLAETAARLTNRHVPAFLDTLAAAYAETGQFERAIEVATEALGGLDVASEPLANELRMRLELYQAGKPYRQQKRRVPSVD